MGDRPISWALQLLNMTQYSTGIHGLAMKFPELFYCVTYMEPYDLNVVNAYEGVSKSFRTESITK
jgi:hypothetical protein